MTITKEQTDTVAVVIIEDYKLTRVGLRSSLNEFEGINVIGEAEDAEKGLKVIEELKPDVVLMDLGLPGMNGIEATQQIKTKYENIKIIILTSHERDEEVMASLGSGANAYCLKDIDPNTLVSVIKSVDAGAAWLDPAIAKVALNLFPKPESTRLLSSSEAPDARAQLTERELEVLRLLVKGKSNTEIAKDLIVSVHTAKAHVCSILQKLCVDDRVQAAVKSIRENII
ncbi:MAG: response regulator transcription factor [Candidatus Gastranaerophilaceae bacterium]|jgi:DNA-binding NarL/FixJ family response regulator